MNAPVPNSCLKPVCAATAARGSGEPFFGVWRHGPRVSWGFEFLGKTYEPLANRIAFANDISDAACQTYRENLGHDIQATDIEDAMSNLPERCDILIGGFPCQRRFSQRAAFAAQGQRTVLYRKMIEAIERTRPMVFVAENVRGLLSCEFGDQVLSDFDLPGYAVTTKVLLASSFGVPQNRERLFIVWGEGQCAVRFPRTFCRSSDNG